MHVYITPTPVLQDLGRGVYCLRCTVLLDDPCTLVCFYAVSRTMANVLRTKHRFNNDRTRDASVNARMMNRRNVEVQLAFDQIVMIKCEKHPMYEITRRSGDEDVHGAGRPQ